MTKGRPSLSAKSIQNIKDDMHEYTMTSRYGAPFTFDDDYKGKKIEGRMSLESFIHRERQKVMTKQGKTKHQISEMIPFQKGTVYKWSRIICPSMVLPQAENDRRVQQLTDMFSAVSHAVISKAIMDPSCYTDGRSCRFVTGNVYTFDAVSGIISGNKQAKVRCQKVTKDALRKLGLGVFTNAVIVVYLQIKM